MEKILIAILEACDFKSCEVHNRKQYQYNFADTRKYAVKIEIDKEDRARSPIYRSRKR